MAYHFLFDNFTRYTKILRGDGYTSGDPRCILKRMSQLFEMSLQNLSTDKTTTKMTEQKMKDGRGGARPGAGRPKLEEETKLYIFRAGGEITTMDLLKIWYSAPNVITVQIHI